MGRIRTTDAHHAGSGAANSVQNAFRDQKKAIGKGAGQFGGKMRSGMG